MKILVIEDQNELRKLVKNFLEDYGYVVDEAEDGEEGYHKINMNSYDCLILDLNLPKLDGIEIARRVREEGKSVPIIMLTARSEIYDKIEGFDNGADDYITKPFDMKELLARVEAVLRRSQKDQELDMKFKEYEVFPKENLLRKDKEEIQLTNKEMGVLEYLLHNKGEIVSAEELLEHVWDSEVDMFSDTVKTHIKTLRKKLDPKKKYLQTIRGKGYMYKES
ncbi:MAG TPA: response regulator transcription factor [Candidatus Dojkabacteria bacterium]|nr:response regulator transcription factor [Candidatus Dojkabacteria bacterium]